MRYDVGNVTNSFLQRTYPQQAELVLEMGQAARNPLMLPVLRAVGKVAAAHSAKPFEVLRIALATGMAMGVFLEMEMKEYKARTPEIRHTPKYAVRYVTRAFLEDACPDQRAVLGEINSELRVQKSAYHLIAEVTEEISRQKVDILNSLRIALMYGLVVGILMEQERK